MQALLDQSEFDRWRRAAAGAQRSAQLQATSDLHNWACFLAEQAAQLALKGLLHGVGAGAWGHDLLVLAEAVQHTVGEKDARWLAALRRLSRHYIPARYPDAHPSGPPEAYYGREDVDAALADLELVLEFIDSDWAALSGRAGAERVP